MSETLQKFIDADTHITYDGGDYCHFLRASIKRDRPFRFHNVSSFGMIGVGVPYALGAQVALPENRVVLSVGDGSFGFNGMEIDTMVRHNLPVKIILGNNSKKAAAAGLATNGNLGNVGFILGIIGSVLGTLGLIYNFTSGAFSSLGG